MRKFVAISLIFLLFTNWSLALEVNLAKGKEYFLAHEADWKYPDDGLKLTDGRFGYPDYKDFAWVGFTNREQFVALDLRDLYQIDRVSVGFLRSTDEAIFFPVGVAVAISEDGIEWEAISNVIYDYRDLPQNKIVTYKHLVDNVQKKARFVAIRIHGSTWVFLDEIEVWGDNSTKAKPPQGVYVDEIEFDLIDFDL